MVNRLASYLVVLNQVHSSMANQAKYLGLQMAADGGCERDVVHRMNEGLGALKSVLSYRGLGIKAKKCQYEGVIELTGKCCCKEQRHGV